MLLIPYQILDEFKYELKRLATLRGKNELLDQKLKKIIQSLKSDTIEDGYHSFKLSQLTNKLLKQYLETLKDENQISCKEFIDNLTFLAKFSKKNRARNNFHITIICGNQSFNIRFCDYAEQKIEGNFFELLFRTHHSIEIVKQTNTVKILRVKNTYFDDAVAEDSATEPHFTKVDIKEPTLDLTKTCLNSPAGLLFLEKIATKENPTLSITASKKSRANQENQSLNILARYCSSSLQNENPYGSPCSSPYALFAPPSPPPQNSNEDRAHAQPRLI